MLLRLNHAHVDVLLVGCGNLLLLLLQDFYLLGDGQLLHHQRRQLRRATSMSDVQTTTGRTHGPLLALLVHARDCVVDMCRWLGVAANVGEAAGRGNRPERTRVGIRGGKEGRVRSKTMQGWRDAVTVKGCREAVVEWMDSRAMVVVVDVVGGRRRCWLWWW